MHRYRIAMLAIFAAAYPMAPTQAKTLTVCTVVADAATGEILKQHGQCGTRATSASTFKLAISLMGFDSGFLKDAHTPALPFKNGYPDWKSSWRSATDPTKWIKESVVWYSQQVTQAIGKEQFARYVHEFHYGNEDVSGDPGKSNGLTHAWLSSSLKISPLEQLDFLGKVVRRELPVSAHAYEMTQAVADIGMQPNGWHVYGKSGAGMSKNSDGTIAKGKPWGWFVGWATNGDRTIIFARLTKDTKRPTVSPGIAARSAVLKDLFSQPNNF